VALPAGRRTAATARRLAAGTAAAVGAILREHWLFLGLIAAYIAIAYAVFGRRLHLFWFAPSELAPLGISALVLLGLCAVRVWWHRRRAERREARESVDTHAGARARATTQGHGLVLVRAAGSSARSAQPARAPGPAPALAARLHAWRHLTWRYARFHFFRPVRIGGALLLYVALGPFMSAFVTFKRAIPRLHPYGSDVALASLGRTLHGGRLPWEWLQPLLGHPLATVALDRIYIAWYGVVSIVTLWQTWSTNRRLRQQYAVSLVLAWAVLGTGLALLWSSVGPVYYGRVVAGPDPYAPLLQYLAAVDARYGLYALDLQRILWKGYVSPASAPFYEGISAMPSLHVALPVLFALLAWRTHRALFWAMTAFAVLIFIGSIHLAWHYALDGYVAAAGVLVFWWVAGRLVRAGERAARSDEHERPAASDEHVRPATSTTDGVRPAGASASAGANTSPSTASGGEPVAGRGWS
jgi:hypothetical protein